MRKSLLFCVFFLLASHSDHAFSDGIRVVPGYENLPITQRMSVSCVAAHSVIVNQRIPDSTDYRRVPNSLALNILVQLRQDAPYVGDLEKYLRVAIEHYVDLSLVGGANVILLDWQGCVNVVGGMLNR